MNNVMNNTELRTIKDHATPAVADSPVSRHENEPPTVASQLESEDSTINVENNNPLEASESHSQLSFSPQQHEEAKEETVVGKESLADWGVVVCVFLSNAIASLDFTGFGVFYPYLVEHFGATTASVGWCSSISGFCQAIVALFASYPIKSYGCRLPAVVGCLLFSTGLSLSCLAPNLTTIYFTYGVIAGAGKGLTNLTTGIIIHQRFSRNRNLASGIGFLGASFGGIIGSIVTNQLIQSYGWRGTFLIFGAIHAQRIPLCMFYRTPKRLISQSNHASGSSPRGLSGRMFLRYLKETFNFSIFRKLRYSMYSVAYVLHIFCLMGYAHHTVNRAINVGLTRDQGVAAASLFSITSTVTRLFVSFISNLPKVKSSLVFATGMFCTFLAIVVIFIDPRIIGTMTSAALFGIQLGCTTTVFTIVVVDIVGVVLLPRGLAILQFIAGFARLISPPFIGWVFDVTRDYNKAFAIIGCMAFVSGSLMVVLTFVNRCRRKRVAKDTELPTPEDET